MHLKQNIETKHMRMILFAMILLTALNACSKSDDNIDTGTGSTNTSVPEVYKKIYGATSITSDGTWITIKSKGVPDHKSPYYSSTSSLYDDFSGITFGGSTFSKNPNSISEKNYSFKIPLNPKEAVNKQATPLGPIGVSLNGVPFFNQYAGPNQPLTNEVVSFDRYWGHPAPGGTYHYHVEPLYLTAVKASRSSLLGFLLDGFPVYGPEENGVLVNNTSLDAYHGHTHATTDFPNGIYHYHITNTDPYINGNGYFGTPGTITQ
jgi:YHYH protein